MVREQNLALNRLVGRRFAQRLRLREPERRQSDLSKQVGVEYAAQGRPAGDDVGFRRSFSLCATSQPEGVAGSTGASAALQTAFRRAS
jgi:hypothetical protein